MGEGLCFQRHVATIEVSTSASFPLDYARILDSSWLFFIFYFFIISSLDDRMERTFISTRA